MRRLDLIKMCDRIDEIVTSAKSFIWSTQKDACYWLYPPYLGPSFVSQHWLAFCHLDSAHKTKFDTGRHKRILLETQQMDGGWTQVPDPSQSSSNLDATVFNYWFLKVGSSTN